MDVLGIIGPMWCVLAGLTVLVEIALSLGAIYFGNDSNFELLCALNQDDVQFALRSYGWSTFLGEVGVVIPLFAGICASVCNLDESHIKQTALFLFSTIVFGLSRVVQIVWYMLGSYVFLQTVAPNCSEMSQLSRFAITWFIATTFIVLCICFTFGMWKPQQPIYSYRTDYTAPITGTFRTDAGLLYAPSPPIAIGRPIREDAQGFSPLPQDEYSHQPEQHHLSPHHNVISPDPNIYSLQPNAYSPQFSVFSPQDDDDLRVVNLNTPPICVDHLSPACKAGPISGSLPNNSSQPNSRSLPNSTSIPNCTLNRPIEV